jgi:diguanylate cyclase (GGDEF)-like protein
MDARKPREKRGTPIAGQDALERDGLVAAASLGCALVLLVAGAIAANLGRTTTNQDFWVYVCALSLIVLAVAIGTPAALRQRKMTANAVGARWHVEQIFHMTDLLQSAVGYADANIVLRATACELLPGLGGSLHIFNNSRDRLDLSTVWNWEGETQPLETLAPIQCWALKSGKPHLNRLGDAAVRCDHHAADVTVLEIPMMARGELYGLLTLQATGPDAEDRLSLVARLASGIAEGMSVTLSNIALRETLRTQALRDPLTGLYNRRYMEDVLERYGNLAGRNGSPLSGVMIDLDHFKALNDEHGHAMGDAVLREVAATLVSAIRPSDVACRYGGEELMVLLPDCTLADALAKAELIRGRIEALSENHGFAITASLGVAAVSETTERWTDLLSNADVALYQAKQGGRNRVVAAPRRAGGLTLAVVAE